jgi:hypothetical protein
MFFSNDALKYMIYRKYFLRVVGDAISPACDAKLLSGALLDCTPPPLGGVSNARYHAALACSLSSPSAERDKNYFNLLACCIVSYG